jgi:hypothetical protein
MRDLAGEAIVGQERELLNHEGIAVCLGYHGGYINPYMWWSSMDLYRNRHTHICVNTQVNAHKNWQIWIRCLDCANVHIQVWYCTLVIYVSCDHFRNVGEGDTGSPHAICCYWFLKIALLTYSSCTIQFTHLKCTIQWFLAYSQSAIIMKI